MSHEGYDARCRAAKLAWLLYCFPKENLPSVHTPKENQERLHKLATERLHLID
jgi:hypothetical protein